VAQKLLATEPVNSFHQLKGEDLSVGGKGMIDYYDNILPKRVLALAREHDPEAKLTSVKSPDKNINGYHAIEITPTMRKSILENGFGVYRDGGTIHMSEGGSDEDYRGSHTAPGPHFGAPMHDVTNNMYPADFYGPNGRRYYASPGWDFDNDAYNKVMRVRGKPHEMVDIHRAIPTSVYKEALKKDAPLKHMIRKGDWVAISKEYAKAHGESALKGDYKIASMSVPAKHVWTNADSIHEWGYYPEENKAHGGTIHKADVGLATAHEMARLNAIKMLGLHENNTAEDRARALGFNLDEKLYHGTNSEFPAFERNPRYGAGTYATEDPEIANIYAESERREGNAAPNVLPIVARGKKLKVSDLNPDDPSSGGWFRDNMAKATGMPMTRRMVEQLPRYGYDRLEINDMSDLGGIQTQHMFPDPSVIRSRFAAFDPHRVNENDLLAARGGLIHKADGGLATPMARSINEMRAELLKTKRLMPNATRIGVNEAPSMQPKMFANPNGEDGQSPPVGGARVNAPLPQGGIDTNRQMPGKQLAPQAPQGMPPQGQPQQGQPQGAPMGAPQAPPPPMGNMLQMTPQGRAMGAMQPPQMASGGEVQGLNGGGKLKDKPQPVYPPAKPISKNTMQMAAEMMARQMSGEDNPNKKTLRQLAREKNLPVDVREVTPQKSYPEVNYESMKGSHLIGIPGDPSIGGLMSSGSLTESPQAAVEIHGIGDTPLSRPVGQFGGHAYGKYGHPEGWASDLVAAASIVNRAKDIKEQNPEAKVYGQYVKMSPDSLYHAMHHLDTLLAYQKPETFPKKHLRNLNNMMRKPLMGYAAFEDFPGFEKPEDVMLQAQMNPEIRKKIAHILSVKRNLPANTPSAEDVIYAITNGDLRNLQTGASGKTIMELHPEREMKQLISGHPTYSHDIPSRVAANSELMMPPEIAFPRSMAEARRQIELMPEAKRRHVQPFGMAKMSGFREPIDEQYINQVGEYQQMLKKLTGRKKGGDVSQDGMQYALMMHKPVHKAGGGGVSGSGKLDLNITMNNCGSAGGQGGAGVTSLGGMASGMTGQLNPTNNLTPNPYGSANPFMGQTNRQQYLQPQVIKQTTQTQPVQGYLGCAQAFATPQQGGTPVCTSAGSTPQQVPTMPSLGMLGMGGLGKIPQPPPLTAAQQKVQDELQKWESSQESQGSMVQGWEITGKLNQLNQQYDPTAPFIMPIN